MGISMSAFFKPSARFRRMNPISNGAAAARLDLHPSSIRRWRQRWAGGQFTFEDDPGRGRKPVFSPPRQGRCRIDRL
jgi:transposase